MTRLPPAARHLVLPAEGQFLSVDLQYPDTPADFQEQDKAGAGWLPAVVLYCVSPCLPAGTASPCSYGGSPPACLPSRVHQR